MTSKGREAGGEPAVSVWRTYLVANEWNELQTRRKTKAGLQLVLIIFLMRVLGLENLSSADPHNLPKLASSRTSAAAPTSASS